ncbi:hypothetical protein TNIN_264871 [Trichonephila inaurata madagascariensis]|uniref:Uncharacterized protein n=1 Tax=Trichonephila inaurata madagascariensis TaxID=2747483 RepID=A0A8X6MM12_9ARAC|nr:hypothetical protein TNIN_264871 [Trichonephila inaurata madagascariensis]
MQSKTSSVARAPVEGLPLERPSERPAEPLMDFLMNEVKVTSRIPTPPLIPHCDKCNQTDSPTLHFKHLGKRPMEQSNKRLKSRGAPKKFCWCSTIILSLHWVMMNSSLNL